MKYAVILVALILSGCATTVQYPFEIPTREVVISWP